MVSIPHEQQEVARFLQALAGTEPIETHISAVFVGTGTAWKLKKAVHLPFFDFTTIEARHHFLQRELELNRPAAPGMYRDVAAVVRERDGKLSLTTEPAAQPPLDWVLRMAPIPEGDFAPLAVLEARLAQRRNDASDATVVVLRHAGARDPGPMDWLEVDACDASVAMTVISRAIAAKTTTQRLPCGWPASG